MDTVLAKKSKKERMKLGRRMKLRMGSFLHVSDVTRRPLGKIGLDGKAMTAS